MMMRALKTMDYNGRRLKAGDVFEPASAGDGRVLALAQLAEEIENGDKPKKKQKYKTRELRAEDE